MVEKHQIDLKEFLRDFALEQQINLFGNLINKTEVGFVEVENERYPKIEHKLAYKKKEHVPDQFKRKLY